MLDYYDNVQQKANLIYVNSFRFDIHFLISSNQQIIPTNL